MSYRRGLLVAAVIALSAYVLLALALSVSSTSPWAVRPAAAPAPADSALGARTASAAPARALQRPDAQAEHRAGSAQPVQRQVRKPPASHAAPRRAVHHRPVGHAVAHRKAVRARPARHAVVRHGAVRHGAVHHRPVHHRPVHHRPVHHRPVHRSPVHRSPVHRSPVHHSPVHHSPVHHKPVHRGVVHRTPVARLRPGYVVQGHYLRSLVGGPRDLPRMWRLGAADAARNPAGKAHLVLLDIGGQSLRGVYLSLVNRYIGYRSLVAAVAAYADGYHARQQRHAPVTIALGTNNDLYTTAFAGRLWATQVVNPVRRATTRFTNISIAGADDIEPGFAAGPAHTRAWLRGYLQATRAKFVFNGSADGCSPRHAWSRCNHGWTAHTLALLAGVIAPTRIIALPQIYNRAMAGQWAQISRTAKLAGHRPLHIVGPLTEERACGRHRSCPSMPSRRAWQLLHGRLRAAGVHPAALPQQVDLDVR